MSEQSVYVIADLILANTRYGEDERVLVLSGDSVDVIEAIAQVAKQVDVFDLSHKVLSRLEYVVRDANVTFYDSVFPTEQEIYDTAHIIVPKGREFGRAQVWAALHALKDGGDLFITGANKGGAKSLISDAKRLFGNATVMNYKKSHRIALCKKDGLRDYPSEWGAIPNAMQSHRLDTAHGTVAVMTMPGVFSWEELDAGTAFLLENLDLGDVKTVLDVGCGNGVIGAALAPNVAQVIMTDDNLLAVRCARATIADSDLKNAMVAASDVYAALKGQTFDLIVSNPPFHQKFDVNAKVAQNIIRKAPNYLKQGGRLVIVANEFLKYEPEFEANFSQFRVIARNNKFKVIEGVK